VLGGFLTKRWGLLRALWVLGLFQAVSNLGYAAAAGAGKPALWAAAAVEPFCTGLGTAPFLALFLVSCRREHAAVQFALLTALMALGRIGAGAVSGLLAKSVGFSAFFALSFLAALPAFLLLPAVRRFPRQ
jgi:PAT family beta-lactamase induction signal transducer AmpG